MRHARPPAKDHLRRDARHGRAQAADLLRGLPLQPLDRNQLRVVMRKVPAVSSARGLSVQRFRGGDLSQCRNLSDCPQRPHLKVRMFALSLWISAAKQHDRAAAGASGVLAGVQRGQASLVIAGRQLFGVSAGAIGQTPVQRLLASSRVRERRLATGR